MNRDQKKRPLMGRIAARLSTKVLFTSDNPRNEDPDNIIEQMNEGEDPVDFKKTSPRRHHGGSPSVRRSVDHRARRHRSIE